MIIGPMTAAPEPLFAPIRPTRASSDVIAQIRRAILSGKYRPGDRLPTEREMAQQFGVSRVTVRDALRALEANGLVRVKVGGQGGPYVSEPDIALLSDSFSTHLQLRGTTFQELAEARLALETTAAQLAAQRATAEDLEALKAAIQGPMQPPLAADTALSSLDFHTALVIAAHNQALLAMFRATRALIQQAFDTLHAQQPDMAANARRSHGDLYAAIAARNPDQAAQLMRRHLEQFAARAERYYAAQNKQ
jgi:DNA-binding FadR family transcriptional regulator